MRVYIIFVSFFLVVSISVNSQSVLRTILIEDFAGHRCGNCPGAHYELEQLKATYGDSLVYVSIHPETIFSEPQTGSGSFETDFRVEEGQQIFTDFGIPSMIPLEMINREISTNPDYYFLASSLATEVPPRIGQLTDFTITTNGVMLPNRVVSATVEVEFVNTVTGSYSLVNYLVEDSIVDWQTSFAGQHPNYSGAPDHNYSNYIHHNIVRDVFGHTGINEGAAPYTGDIYGEPLVGTTNVGDIHSFVINSFPMDLSWNENQVSIVSYLFDNTTKEILQVNQSKINMFNSLQQENWLRFNLYPNPASEFVSISFIKQFKGEVIVYDLLGQAVLTKSVEGKVTQIDLSKLPSFGQYIVKIVSQDGVNLGTKRLMFEK